LGAAEEEAEGAETAEAERAEAEETEGAEGAEDLYTEGTEIQGLLGAWRQRIESLMGSSEWRGA
jgi:hypothetical protein